MGEDGAAVAGYLYGVRLRIEKILKENRAFDENSALDPERFGIKEKGVLRMMTEDGHLMTAADGKRIYFSEKGRVLAEKRGV
jgi:hypothetical protein